MNTTQITSYGKALYYPYIHVQDVNWLKLSLLYFDGIRRIVPQYTNLNDDDDVRRIVDEGLLEEISPEKYRESAEKKFREDFLSLLSQDIPEAKLALEQASQTFSKKNVSITHLNLSKMTNDLSNELMSMGLASQVGDWLEVNAHLAGAYMMCLASVMSASIQSPLITDTPEYQGLGEYLSFGEFSKNLTTEPHSLLLKLGINFPDAKSLEQVSIAKILQFHDQRKDERTRFRQTIESIATTANQISDPIALNDYLSQERQGIKSAIEDYQKTQDELSVKWVASFFGVTAPTAISYASGLTIPPLAAVLTGVAVTVTLIGWWAEIRGNQREKVKSSPWHYLLPLEQLYRPKTPLGIRLLELRQQAIADGEPLLTAKQIEQEIAERRG